MIRVGKIKLLLPLLAFMLIFSGCNGNDSLTDPSQDDSVILEPGFSYGDIKNDPDEEGTDPDEQIMKFIDKGDATTIADLEAAQAKIQSYYFEQTIPYTNASVFVRVWYYNNKMKVISSVDGYVLTEFYYNYDDMTMISYSPADSDKAVMMDFDINGADAPGNPLSDDFSTSILVGSEELARQLCFIVETATGDKKWISTKYGFPLQVEFVDHLGDQYTVGYRNVKINTVTEEAVEFPADIPIYYVNTGSGE